MRIEVLCTGEELLTGVTADTNSPFFMARLLRLGERVSRTTVVGDDLGVIRDALREVTARADVVLVSGGLGPTADDVTAEAAAQAAGVPLVMDAGTYESIRRRFAERGLELTPNNARQAMVPEGAEVIPNAVGSSPMFSLRIGRATAFFLPGVPREYRHLVEHELLPRLKRLREAGGATTFHGFRVLKTIGLPESHLDRRVAPLAARFPEVTFGFRAVAPECHLELLTTARTQERADTVLGEVERASREALGEFFFGSDEETLAGMVIDQLRARGETVAIAESCTGGLTAAMLTAVSGASDVFPGAMVPYLPELKTQWAGVPAALIAEHGVVSAAVAEALAQGVRGRAGATWGIGITGYAGPTGGDAREPVGAVYLCVAGPREAHTTRHVFAGERERVRQFASAYALEALRRRMLLEGSTNE